MEAFIQFDNLRLIEMTISDPPTHITVHEDLKSPMTSLLKSAAENGFDIVFASAYRSYDSQVKIWNEKVLGQRPVRDQKGNILDITKLSEVELIFAILRWSALPGTSRHQWGTDLDFFDRANLPSGYKLQLISSEYEMGGPFYNAKCWLNKNADQFGFYFPYQTDRGGVMPEPWHMSYRPLATNFLQELTFAKFVTQLKQADFLMANTALKYAEQIFNQFIINID